MRTYSFYIIIFSMILAAPSFASEKEDVKKGNILYNKGDYSGAAKLYEKAAMEKSGSGIPELNRGAALYRDGAYNKAIQSFNRSIASGRADLVRAADYNIGNSTYRIGASKDSADKEKKNIKKTAEVYATALQYYKRAIDLDPSDKDAKFNYEFVAKKIEELSPLFQIKQEEDKKKEQEKNNKDKEDQDNQGQKQDQQKNEQQKDQQQDQKKDEQQDQQKNEQQKDQQEKDKSEQGQGGESQPKGEKEPQSEDQKKDKGDSGEESEQKKKEPQAGEEGDKSKPDQEKDKEDQGQAGEDKESRAKDQEEEKEAQTEEQAEGADEGKEEAQAQEEQGAEEAGKPEEKQEGLVAYQDAQKDPAEGTEMTEQEAKMLLEGYKGEEATGRMVKMRRKSADMAEPAKDW